MAGGYASPTGDGLEVLGAKIQGLSIRLSELEAPTGTSLNSLVAQVQEAIANIDTTVTASIAANSYTKSQIDSKIASPGAISPTNVTASGQVDSAGYPLKSQPSFNYMVATSYKGAWIDGATFQVGYSPSAAAVKTNLVPMGDEVVAQLMSLTPYWGRYLWDEPTSPPKVFFLAADVQTAGFGPDVAPVVEAEPFAMIGADGEPVVGVDGEPVVIPVGQAYTVNYSQLVVPLLAALRAEVDRGVARDSLIANMAARLDAAGL